MKRVFSLAGWIFALAFLSVGLRNFQTGLSIDGPLYATIARNLAHAGGASWFRLASSVPEFQPYFAEHPHLGFWVMAAFFKVLPEADWSARLPSHLFYVASLGLLYFWVARLSSSARAATLTVILIWAFPILSNFFSNAYLDPQMFFFGLLAVVALETATAPRGTRIKWAFLAGAALAAAALTKGLAVLGFGPVMAYLIMSRWRIARAKATVAAGLCLLSAAGILAAYGWALSRSDVPDFLHVYLARQWSGRFAVSWDWSRLFHWHFYRELIRETHGLLVLVPVALVITGKPFPRGDAARLPLILILSFVLMLVPADRIGHQYWILLLPWAAWWIALGLDRLLPAAWTDSKLQGITSRVSMFLVVFLQYIPFQVYRSRLPALAPSIATRKGATRLWLEDRAIIDPFIRTSTWSWYTGLPVAYASREAWREGDLRAEASDVVVFENLGEGAERERLVSDLGKRGLCPGDSNADSIYFMHCR